MHNLLFNIVFCFLLFFSSHLAFAGITNIPSSFLPSDEFQLNKQDGKIRKFEKYLDHILNYQEEVLTEVDKSSIEPFIKSYKLNSFKTDLSLTKAGLFGIGSLGTISAVQLTWSRKNKVKKQKSSLYQKKKIDLNPVEINLTEDMTEEELLTEIKPIVDLAVNSGRVKNKKKMKRNLFKRIKKIHQHIGDIFGQRKNIFVPFAFAIDLSFDVSGNILGYMRLGGSFRLRLGWMKKKRSNFVSVIKNKKIKSKSLNKLVKNITQYISNAVIESDQRFLPYRISGMTVGIATFQSGKWGLAKTRVDALGILYFNRVQDSYFSEQFLGLNGQTTSNSNETFLVKDTPLKTNDNLIALSSVSRPKFFKLSYRKFKKGIKKSFKIGKWVAKRAAKKVNKWQISKFKTAFAVTYTGLFGLSTNTSGAFAELYYSKI